MLAVESFQPRGALARMCGPIVKDAKVSLMVWIGVGFGL
jgi:hypothetical protein